MAEIAHESISKMFVHKVVVFTQDEMDHEWDDMMTWCESDDIAGQFSWETDYEHALRNSENHRITFVFSDPNAAFAFKMRWA